MKPQRHHPTHNHTHQVAKCKLPVFSSRGNKTNMNSKTGLLAPGPGGGLSFAFSVPATILTAETALNEKSH